MTYRDDHDAALNRIAALEDELERAKVEQKKAETERHAAERERDRLAQEVALAKPAPVKIVVAPAAPLTTGELDRVAEELERGARSYRTGAWLAITVAASLFCLAVAIHPLVAVFGAVVAIGGMISLWQTSPEQWRPVLAAVREAPENIIAIERRPVGRSVRPYRITLHTRWGQLRLYGDGELCRLLERHCPTARLDD